MRGPGGPGGRLLADVADHATDAQLLDAVAQRVVRMRMSVPAVFFLESVKPMSYVGSQALVFFEPFVQTIFTVRNYQRFAGLLEDRENLERLIQRIETFDQEHEAAQRAAKKAEKAEKAETAKTAGRAAEGTGSRWGGWWRRWRGRAATAATAPAADATTRIKSPRNESSREE